MSNLDRYEDICILVSAGYTYREIGERYGITKQRVEQIIKDGRPTNVRRVNA